MTVLVILGAAVMVFGAFVLLFLPERPGGEFEFKGLTVKSPAAGIPLILAGLVAVVFGSGAASQGGLHQDRNGSDGRISGSTPPLQFSTGPSSPFAADTILELSETSGSPGTALTVTGKGFSPRETIEINLAKRRLNTVTADGKGSFAGVPVSIPGDWPFKGQVDIIATGRSSIRSVAEPFEVR
jgi:hypothetical protein